MKVSIKCCARCEQDHDDLEFTELSKPIDEWTFWAKCPTTGEPILLLIETEEAQS